MSKLANRPVEYPADVSVSIKDGFILASKGGVTEKVSLNGISVNVDSDKRECSFFIEGSKISKANLGTVISLFRSVISGFSTPYSLTLSANGVGFKAMVVNANMLLMWLGRSHLYAVNLPKEVTVTAKDNKIFLTGKKTVVTAVASLIKTNRKWDPCMKKGVVIEGQFVVVKEGKKKK